ncbi:MAG: ATP-binding cassette domain-containing protein [Christensenellales bacterium]|jgi:ABC-type glutathione transport system ATPase component
MEHQKLILEVKGLTVMLAGTDSNLDKPLLDNINITIDETECVGIIGGSGSGKSVLLSAIINSLSEPLMISKGEVILNGINLLEIDLETLRKEYLGRQVASIKPNPHWRLDPIDTIGNQIKRIYMSHFRVTNDQAHSRVIELLGLVGIPDPEKRYNSFPNELSGGMAQRVLITIALICEPSLLLADEPTGGLDVTIQIQVFNLIKGLISENKLSTLIASRDIGLLYHLCDRIYVLNDGRIVESGKTNDIVHFPVHPYTAKLIGLAEADHQVRESTNFQNRMKTTEEMYAKICSLNEENAVNGWQLMRLMY